MKLIFVRFITAVLLLFTTNQNLLAQDVLEELNNYEEESDQINIFDDYQESEKQSYVIDHSKINPSNFYKKAIIQALDKSTARKSDLSIAVGSERKFDNILIKIHKCWKAPLQQAPESKALIQVIEEIKYSYETKTNNLFFGWIFASTPSISGLEHPIYDLTLINCTD